jgi:hypothetical protein
LNNTKIILCQDQAIGHLPMVSLGFLVLPCMVSGTAVATIKDQIPMPANQKPEHVSVPLFRGFNRQTTGGLLPSIALSAMINVSQPSSNELTIS